jgi:ElaB/YqjD/DUF883 family membrane-anchored ribosome-binding protein
MTEDYLNEDRIIFRKFLDGIKSTNRDTISINRVLKSLTNDNTFVTKGKAKIGDIREWKTGKFKKVSEGQWVKVEDTIPQSGEEIVQELKDQTEHNITLNPKQEAYLKEKLDKLKFFNIATLEKNQHTNAILQAVKDKNPNLDITDANKTVVIAEMQNLIKDVLQKKLDSVTGVTEAVVSPDTASADDLMSFAKKKTELYDKLVELQNKTSDMTKSQKELQQFYVKEALDKGDFAKVEHMLDMKAEEISNKITNELILNEAKAQSKKELPTIDDDTQYPQNQSLYEEHPAKVSYEDLNFESKLGGSTGAELWSDSKGNKYVSKAGNSEKHIENEYHANNLYASVGLDIPDIALKNVNGQKKQLAKLIDGTVLGDFLSKASPTEVNTIKKELRKGFMYDAILANWDVVGMSKDNIIVSKEGKPFRIDNGGSMIFRAQGGLKDFKGGLPLELNSMRDTAKNPSAGAVYGGMSNDDVANHIIDQVKSGNITNFKKAISDSNMPQDRKEVLQSRVDHTVSWAENHMKSKAPLIPTPPPQQHSAIKFSSDMDKHMSSISQWSKKNLLSSAKISDFVKYAQKTSGKDFNGLDKNGIVKELKNTWNQIKTASISGDGFVLKSQVSQQRGFKPPISSLAESYKSVSLSNITSKYKDYSSSSLKDLKTKLLDYHRSVPPDIAKAMKSYTGSWYQDMNNFLRGVDSVASKEIKDIIAKTDAYLTNAPKYIGDTYRGVTNKGSFVADMKKALISGEPYEMHGFSSSAVNISKAWKGGHSSGEFNKGVLIQIKSKNGVYVDPVSSHKGEAEVLHNTHMKYKVVDYQELELGDHYPQSNTKSKHKHYIMLEEI